MSPVYTHCIACKQSFSPSNVHTRAGALETQISGMCEDCFDAAFEGMDDEDEGRSEEAEREEEIAADLQDRWDSIRKGEEPDPRADFEIPPYGDVE
jgi:hypothetical protein